jgi:hypothetical protein
MDLMYSPEPREEKETPCGACFTCLTRQSDKPIPRNILSFGNYACLDAQTALIESVLVCSKCGAHIYNSGGHSRDYPDDWVCRDYIVITRGEYRKMRKS